MKTLNYLAMIFAVLLTACTKEADILQPMKPKNSILGLQVEVHNGMLFFKDAIEYASFIEKEDADSLLTIMGALDGFISCYEWMSDSNEVNFMHSIQEESETILKLLNKDGLVHIQNKVYRINSKTETVYMIDSSYADSPGAIAALIAESSGEGVTSESVDRDLYELNGLPDAKAGCPTIGENKIQFKQTTANRCTSPFTGQLRCEVKYLRYGVYFELFSRVENPDFNTSFYCNSTQLISNPAYYIKNGSSVPFNEVSTHVYTNYGRKNWHQGSRRLCSFLLKTKARIPLQNKETDYAEIRFNY